MLPSLQPSRPKPPQQPGAPTLTHQQRRAPHTTPSYPQPQPQLNPHLQQQPPSFRPRSQIEAMPPSAFHPAAPFFPPQSFYDSAVRHPVFFTETLRKPPFPIPSVASQGWSPVASGYIAERGRVEGGVRTKL